MYIERIKYQEKKGSEWKDGFYIGEYEYYESCEKSTVLDKNYQPLPKDENGYQVWDLRPNYDKKIVVFIEE